MDGISPLPEDDWTAQQRSVIDEWVADRSPSGPPGEIWCVLLRSPEGTRRLGKLGAFARMHSSLPDSLRVVCSFIAASHRGFQYEIEVQTANLQRLGFSHSAIEGLRSERADSLDVTTAAVADVATAIARAGHADPEITGALAQLIGEEGLVDVVIVTTYFLMLSDIAAVLLPDPRPVSPTEEGS